MPPRMTMLKILDLEQAMSSLLRRPPVSEIVVTEGMRQRTIAAFGEDLPPEEAVRRILSDVRARGDQALVEWTRTLDGVAMSESR